MGVFVGCVHGRLSCLLSPRTCRMLGFSLCPWRHRRRGGLQEISQRRHCRSRWLEQQLEEVMRLRYRSLGLPWCCVVGLTCGWNARWVEARSEESLKVGSSLCLIGCLSSRSWLFGGIRTCKLKLFISKSASPPCSTIHFQWKFLRRFSSLFSGDAAQRTARLEEGSICRMI